MKKLRTKIDKWLNTLDTRWRALPLQQQYRYLMCCFLIYLLLTIAVVIKVWYDFKTSNQNLVIKHIEKPVVRKKEFNSKLKDSLINN